MLLCAARAMPSSRLHPDEGAGLGLLAAEIDARWHSPKPRHRFWHGALLSLGLHLGTAAMAAALMLHFPEGASSPEEGAEAIEVEIVGMEAFDAAFSAAGAQPQPETQPIEAPFPDIPLPPDLPQPTERDLMAEADMPMPPPPPQPTMPDPMDVLTREIAQAKSETPPAVEPEPQPQKLPAKAETPRKPAPEKPVAQKPVPKMAVKTRVRPTREAARGQGESGKDTDATSSLAATRGAQARTGSAGGSASANASFRASVMAHLARHKRYPEAARIQRMRGRAMVTFSFDASGTVTGVALARSSGSPTLDREALAMVRRASPFPRIPPESGQASVSFTAPIVYDMN